MARVDRHECERDRWEMVHAAPDPRLDGYVLDYCAYDERTASFTRRRELPSDRVVIIVNLGEPIRVFTDAWTDQPFGFFAGMHDTFAISETCGAQSGVQIDLSPVGAHLLLRTPMHELTGRVVALADLLGRSGSLLHEALASTPGWAAKFERLDEFFLARLDDALSPVPSVTRALGRLRASGGSVRVDTLAAELGCSRRHLVAGFREQVGVPPKTLARILRFHRAVGMMGSGPGWAEIALSCGYYDQAHLIRDFNQFAGSSPSDFARRTLPDGGGVVGD